MVEVALSSAEQAGYRVNETSLFERQVRNLIEVPHEAGVQVSKSYIQWEKQKRPEGEQSVQIFMEQLQRWKQE